MSAMPIHNNTGISSHSLNENSNMEKLMAYSIFPMNLHIATSSYFAFSLFGIVLYPASKNVPFPRDKKNAMIRNGMMSSRLMTAPDMGGTSFGDSRLVSIYEMRVKRTCLFIQVYSYKVLKLTLWIKLSFQLRKGS